MTVPLPDIHDLTKTLRFSPELGRIWRAHERCVLLTADTVGSLREQMISRLGWSAARQMFWDLGFAEGARCAAAAKTFRPDADYFRTLAVGPQAHALTGFGWTEFEKLEVDSVSNRLEGLFRVYDSLEAGAHLARLGVSADPVCWLQAGFASGFATMFAGRPIIMREIECVGMGDASCLLHAKPAEEWLDDHGNEQGAACTAPSVNGQTTAAGEIIGVSAGFLAARLLVEKIADTTATLLFQGETGVGKEVFARLAHRLSARRDGPLVTINCAAIPEGLIEAELFGVAKGAYTGASVARPGRFERAHGGTLFLDEISSLSPLAQSKVLRAIQEQEIERVGGVRPIPVDVRIIGASNVDLREEVQRKSFRADLYYRLATCLVRIPPLRERREDIPLLMEAFRDKFNKKHRRLAPGFTNRAISALLMYDYPGNVRELERLVERAVLLSDEGQPIDLRHLFHGEELAKLRSTMEISFDGSVVSAKEDSSAKIAHQFLRDILSSGKGIKEIERVVIGAAVTAASGNISQAARSLGLTRRQLAFRLQKQRNQSSEEQ